jgi:DNA repair exonuclease SbcCD ATPase subunit
MLKLKTVSMRNFLSVGNVVQTVDLSRTGLSLVLGENLDLGGNGSRNGVGKSTLLAAISYALYGQALTNIRVNNLINHINGKNMEVSIEFELGEHSYKIERGRKPNFFRYMVDDKNISDTTTDEAQGENKETQAEIEKLLGQSHTMFKQVVALNTYSEPFLSMGGGKQREIIEELLGITQLSQKADNLRNLMKNTRTEIEQEEFRIGTVKRSNEKIAVTIADLENKSRSWEAKRLNEIQTLESAIATLDDLDVDGEIAAHAQRADYLLIANEVAQLNKDLRLKARHRDQLQTQLTGLITQYEKASGQRCPMCEQGIRGHKHESIISDLETRIATLDQQVSREQSELDAIDQQVSTVAAVQAVMQNPQTFYKTPKEANDHKNTIDRLIRDLTREHAAENPYTAQLDSLNGTLQEVDYENLNQLAKNREHQEFLYKLLTNKESFIRKKIIDQNLAYLNARLAEYLAKLGLPHEVRFMNDLSVSISIMGNELDFDNLSRGERTRLILGLSWSFRDIWENANTPINLVFIDEVLDQGLDGMGVEKAIEILKQMSRDRNKSIFLISHREELVARVNSVLTVIKENQFTSFDWDYEAVV